MKPVVYFVVSLPRTGTTSICEMAHRCGLRPRHAPGLHLEGFLARNAFDLYCDTPIYVPEVVESLCVNESITPKFIYVVRHPAAIFESWVKSRLFANYERLRGRYFDPAYSFDDRPAQKFDFESYNAAFGGRQLDAKSYKALFVQHRRSVLEIIASHNREAIAYEFSQGWGPFCAFIERPEPEAPLPHLNTGRMLEKHKW
jgi:hypothetical protein